MLDEWSSLFMNPFLAYAIKGYFFAQT